MLLRPVEWVVGAEQREEDSVGVFALDERLFAAVPVGNRHDLPTTHHDTLDAADGTLPGREVEEIHRLLFRVLVGGQEGPVFLLPAIEGASIDPGNATRGGDITGGFEGVQ